MKQIRSELFPKFARWMSNQTLIPRPELSLRKSFNKTQKLVAQHKLSTVRQFLILLQEAGYIQITFTKSKYGHKKELWRWKYKNIKPKFSNMVFFSANEMMGEK